METVVKTLKEEVIEYLTQSENAQLFEAVKQEIECFEENGRSIKNLMDALLQSENDLRHGRVIPQEEIKNELNAWIARRAR
jgi:hypothetical protein